MQVYRIVKSRARVNDLSGTGAFKVGGRWNSPGQYALYTSESSSLALLECLVHFEPLLFPPKLHVITLQVSGSAPIYTLPDDAYPADWLKVDLLANKELGDSLLTTHQYLGIRLRSAINPEEYNLLLDPLFLNFARMVKVKKSAEIVLDARLRGQ